MLTNTTMQWEIQNLGLIDYDSAVKLMNELHGRRVANLIGDTLLVLQHHPVITVGRRLHGEKITLSPELEKRGVIVREADRGGLLTYHGPGQAVVYFIVDFKNYASGIADFVRKIEDALLLFLKTFAVTAKIKKDHPGIWVGEKKIASIGLRVAQGITRHGIAFNIANDLSVYAHFNPCGLDGSSMTNLRLVLGKNFSAPEIDMLTQRLVETFVTHFCEEVLV